jgi:uracil-DNA glycosylase
MHAEVRIVRPRLVIPVGKLAIAQIFPETDKLVEIIGDVRRGTIAGHELDVIALPHPSGASTWHRMEPGKTLLAKALAKIAQHDAWRSLTLAQPAA